jgi:hypothetical protein
MAGVKTPAFLSFKKRSLFDQEYNNNLIEKAYAFSVI